MSSMGLRWGRTGWNKEKRVTSGVYAKDQVGFGERFCRVATAIDLLEEVVRLDE